LLSIPVLTIGDNRTTSYFQTCTIIVHGHNALLYIDGFEEIDIDVFKLFLLLYADDIA